MGDLLQFVPKPKAKTASVQDLAAYSSEVIQLDWEKYSRSNKLNEYFIESTSAYADLAKVYTQDLNAVASLEDVIGLQAQILSPGFSGQSGWLAGFRVQDQIVATPYFDTESYARCFNVLLYLKLKRELHEPLDT